MSDEMNHYKEAHQLMSKRLRECRKEWDEFRLLNAELLEALEEIVEINAINTPDGGEAADEMKQIARAAIAKARGD